MAAKKPKEIGPIPPDRFDKMSVSDRLLHLESLGREAMMGKAKWIERTGSLGKQVEQYKAAKSQSVRRSILREMGQQVQNAYAKRNPSPAPAPKKMTVGDAYRAAKGGGSTGSGSGGGGPKGVDKDSSTQ